MLLKTHLTFAIFIIILFIQHVESKIVFAAVVLVATALPDLDSGYSTLGKYLIFKPLQIFVKHRGIIHSFTTGILISILLAIFLPVVSLGFFIGYSAHLICDSFTVEGIQPFWPLRTRSSGFIYTGGRIEETLFFSLIFINIALFLVVFIF